MYNIVPKNSVLNESAFLYNAVAGNQVDYKGCFLVFLSTSAIIASRNHPSQNAENCTS